jgi:hypothetical protein
MLSADASQTGIVTVRLEAIVSVWWYLSASYWYDVTVATGAVAATSSRCQPTLDIRSDAGRAVGSGSARCGCFTNYRMKSVRDHQRCSSHTALSLICCTQLHACSTLWQGVHIYTSAATTQLDINKISQHNQLQRQALHKTATVLKTVERYCIVVHSSSQSSATHMIH